MDHNHHLSGGLLKRFRCRCVWRSRICFREHQDHRHNRSSPVRVHCRLRGGPTKDRLGFRYWEHPGAMKAYVSDGSAGRFLGFFSTLVNAAFAYGGVEMVAVAAGEAENPRKVCLFESSCSFSTGLWVIDHFLRASTVTPVHYRNNLIADSVAYRTYQRLSDESSGGFCSSMFSVLLPLVS